MKVHKIGIIMNGVTGRMGTNQHLIRSIKAIIDQGGVKLNDSEIIMPDPILVGRNAAKVEELAKQHAVERWTKQRLQDKKPLSARTLNAHLVALTAFGTYFARFQRSSKDYFLTGHSVPWWAICFTIVATETSTLSFIGVPAGISGSANDEAAVELIPRCLHAGITINRGGECHTLAFSDEVMPAKGDPLSPQDIALLRRWIEEGAVWPEFAVERLTLTPLADERNHVSSIVLQGRDITQQRAAERHDRRERRRCVEAEA